MSSMVSPTSAARSSLEEMLESIRLRDEKPKDIPPALPTRPVSKARLPAGRKSLHLNFRPEGSAPDKVNNGSREKERKKRTRKSSKDEKELMFKTAVFGSRKMPAGERGPLDDCPYVRKTEKDSPQDSVKENNSHSDPPSPLVKESEWGDNIGKLLKMKLRVWCQLPNGQWESGKTQSSSGEDGLVMLSDGRIVKVPTENILPANPDILEGVDDLIQLSYLNEPSVLYNLKYRYSHNLIYTKAGPVLVAINPFKHLQIYGNDFVTAYRQKLMDSPHVYAIADTAFSEMMRVGKVEQGKLKQPK